MLGIGATGVSAFALHQVPEAEGDVGSLAEEKFEYSGFFGVDVAGISELGVF